MTESRARTAMIKIHYFEDGQEAETSSWSISGMATHALDPEQAIRH